MITRMKKITECWVEPIKKNGTEKFTLLTGVRALLIGDTEPRIKLINAPDDISKYAIGLVSRADDLRFIGVFFRDERPGFDEGKVVTHEEFTATHINKFLNMGVLRLDPETKELFRKVIAD